MRIEVYCPQCNEYVSTEEIEDEEPIQITCPHCNYVITIEPSYEYKEYIIR